MANPPPTNVVAQSANLKDVIIPAGWSAFYDPQTKIATGFSQFKNGGKAKTELSILSSDTEANLRASATAQGCRSTPVTGRCGSHAVAQAAPAAPVPQPRSSTRAGGCVARPSCSTTCRTARKWSGA